MLPIESVTPQNLENIIKSVPLTAISCQNNSAQLRSNAKEYRIDLGSNQIEITQRAFDVWDIHPVRLTINNKAIWGSHSRLISAVELRIIEEISSAIAQAKAGEIEKNLSAGNSAFSLRTQLGGKSLSVDFQLKGTFDTPVVNVAWGQAFTDVIEERPKTERYNTPNLSGLLRQVENRHSELLVATKAAKIAHIGDSLCVLIAECAKTTSPLDALCQAADGQIREERNLKIVELNWAGVPFQINLRAIKTKSEPEATERYSALVLSRAKGLNENRQFRRDLEGDLIKGLIGGTQSL